MKVARIPATPQELIPILTCPNIDQPSKILRTEIAPNKLSKKGEKGTSQ
jgi:hypothetical protein